ncbi:unnamed protein product [Paramecium sonneborni]|uniref:Uncharacterized protein n=1 Tax=Paramecium sonneborni TaxID=65129 RepID=A0A8S1QHC6_9CILI|nr:unnamed protein product [Paramecium sonneborni]
MLKLTEIMDSTCNFCEYQYDFAVIIKKALYEKYSSSQNYTYIRIINDLIFARRSRITNTFKDYLFWDYHDEYMENYFHSPNDILYDTIISNTNSLINLCPAYFIHLLLKPWIITTILKLDNLENTLISIPLAFLKFYRVVSLNNNSNSVHKEVSFLSKINLMILLPIVHYHFIPLINVALQLRLIYQKFCDRRQETKKLKFKKKSLAHSIDKETQTQPFQYIPIIYHKDKQFLQKIIKQQKEKEATQVQFQKFNKLNKTSRCRNSVEIHNNRYGSASKISQQSTARVYESNASSRYNSTATQQKLIRSQRTKSQTQDSNNITKALESQFNNQVDVRQTLKKFDSGIKQKKVK